MASIGYARVSTVDQKADLQCTALKASRCGGHFRSSTEGITTTGAMGRPCSVMSAFAQLKRDHLVERIRAGKAAAAVNGRRARRREITSGDRKVKRVRELKAHGLKPLLRAAASCWAGSVPLRRT